MNSQKIKIIEINKFSIDRINQIIDKININYKKQEKIIYVIKLSTIVIFNNNNFEKFIFQNLDKNKKILLIKFFPNSLMAKGFFRLPVFLSDLIILNSKFSYNEIKNIKFFKDDNQNSLVLRKYLEENFLKKEIITVTYNFKKDNLKKYFFLNIFKEYGFYSFNYINLKMSEKLFLAYNKNYFLYKLLIVIKDIKNFLRRINNKEFVKNYEKTN